MGHLPGPEVPWIWRCVAACATLEDVVLCCVVPGVQMYSGCIPVHLDVLVSCLHCYMLCTVILLCGQ